MRIQQYNSFRFFLTGLIVLVSTASAIPQTGGYYNTRYSRTRVNVELKLKDTVSPEFVAYHFKRFRYEVVWANIHQVEAFIQDTVSSQDLSRIANHPAVDKISVEQQFVDAETPDSARIKILFKHSASDELIHKFVAMHRGFNIELRPRMDKTIVIKAPYWATEVLESDLEMLIYVDKATVLTFRP